jgi:hypothetical protein
MRRQSADESSSKGFEDACVAHDRIDATEPLGRSANDRFSTLGAVHGVVRSHRHAARKLDLPDDPVGDAPVSSVPMHGSTDIVHHHRRATSCQLEGVEPAEASPRSRDDGDLALEVDHARLLHASHPMSRLTRGDQQR